MNNYLTYNTKCAIHHCEDYNFALGYCSAHYQRLRKYGDATYWPIIVKYLKRHSKVRVRTQCQLADCTNQSYAKRYCEKHYARLLKSGDVHKVTRVVGENRTKHPLYKAYHAMLDRCNNPNNTHYVYYGGRGLQVSKEWQGNNGFRQFLEDMGMRPEGHTLDRIDNSKGYSKDNCRWTTRYIQQSNQRINHLNTSGHKGVHLYSANGKWTAYINVKGKRKHLGYFGTKQEAIDARQKAEQLR